MPSQNIGRTTFIPDDPWQERARNFEAMLRTGAIRVEPFSRMDSPVSTTRGWSELTQLNSGSIDLVGGEGSRSSLERSAGSPLDELLKEPYRPRDPSTGLRPLPPGDLADIINQPRVQVGPPRPAPPPVIEQPRPSPSPPRPPPASPPDLPSAVDIGSGGGGGLFNSLLGSRAARVAGRALRFAEVLGPWADFFSLWDTYLNEPPAFSNTVRRPTSGPKRRRGPRTRAAPHPVPLLGDDPMFMREVAALRERPIKTGSQRVPAVTAWVPREPTITAVVPKVPRPAPVVAPTEFDLFDFLLGALVEPLKRGLRLPRSPGRTPGGSVSQFQNPSTASPRSPPRSPSTPEPTTPTEPSDFSSPSPSTSAPPQQPPDCRAIAQAQRKAKRKACKVIGYETVTIKRRVCAKGK